MMSFLVAFFFVTLRKFLFMIRRLFLTWLVSGMCMQGFAQPDIMKIAPPSPTVASLGKYGDMPVNMFNGTPGISIPLHEIKSRDLSLSLSLSLSYHASGIKVEEQASWVGLGWSLNCGGIITRSVRGITDDTNGGYMNPGTGRKVSEIMAMPEGAAKEQVIQAVAQGITDTEPDIFFYNFGSVSGKFYFSQELNDFVVVPREAIKIDKDYFIANRKWRITDTHGVVYYFDLEERSSTNGTGGLSTTGWLLTQIQSAVTNETIMLYYDEYDFTTNGTESHTAFAAFASMDVPSCIPQIGTIQKSEISTIYYSHKLASIEFDAGKVEFISSSSRCDVPGDARLDSIKIYNYSQDIVKQYAFDYDYFNASYLNTYPCGNLESVKMLRLKLESVAQLDGNGQALPPHQFFYNESISLPGKQSFAQDIWGYYNGKNSNSTLVPQYVRPDKFVVTGGNRDVDTLKTQAAVLNRIDYPTGGHTILEYENHSVAHANHIRFSQNRAWRQRSAQLDINDVCNGSSTVFCEQVTINNSYSYGVENFDGAYVSISIVDINNCSTCPSAQSCAVLSFNGTITCNLTDVFVSNGTYELRADFTGNTDPSEYAEFAILVTWWEFSPTDTLTDIKLGGLRIKKITDYDENNIATTQYFNYSNDNGYSSGKVVSPRHNLESYLDCVNVEEPHPLELSITHIPYVERKAFSNIPMGTAQGSPVGYEKVVVTRETNGSLGKSVYKYSFVGDVPYYGPEVSGGVEKLRTEFEVGHAGLFPYVPFLDLDHRRGLLLEKSDYHYTGTDYQLIRKIENEYSPDQFDGIPSHHEYSLFFDLPNPLHHVTTGLKSAFLEKWSDGRVGATRWRSYLVPSEWIRLMKTTEWIYDGGNSFQVVKEYEYSNSQHQQVTKTTTTDSDGNISTTYMRYPLDYTPGSSTVAGIKKMQDKNIITPVVEQISTTKEASGQEFVASGMITTYDQKPLPQTIFALPLTQSSLSKTAFTFSEITGGNLIKQPGYESRIQFSKFDYSNGNLLEQQKENDVVLSYLWGYNNLLPIAEVTGSGHSEIFHTSFEETGTAFTGTGGVNQAFTGNKVLNSGTYSFPGSFAPSLPANLVMTYWYWNGSQWVFSGEVPYDATINTVGTKLDEVRVYPRGAQMKTYTHKPGIGVTTMTDTNNVVQYFEYDSFGRLLAIRDSKGQLLQHYQYNYKTTTQSSQ
jgi:YD repeat-containing protein